MIAAKCMISGERGWAGRGPSYGDRMTPEEFRAAGHQLVDWIADHRLRVPDLPVGAQVSSRVDQPNNVAVVMTAPSAADLTAFYRRTAAANGFTVTADDTATSTLTFAGFGWTGAFTGDAQASALLLRPAP